MSNDDKLRQLDAAIEDAVTDARAKWSNFDERRKALSEDPDFDPTDDSSEAFDAVHELHREAGEAADRVEDLRAKRDKVVAVLGERGRDGTKAEKATRELIKDGLASRESHGARIVAGEAYKALRDSGVLVGSARVGNVVLGQLMSRDEFASSLNPSASVVVTDAEGDDTVRPFMLPFQRGFIEPRFRPLILLDLISVGTIDTDSIEYVVETGYVNNAAFVAEAQTDAAIGGGVTAEQGGLKPQSRLSYEKRTETVSTLAHWVAATKKSLADVSRLRSLIDNRLRRGLADVLEDSIIEGDGTGEELLGILNTEGIQHQERTAGEPLVNDLLRALTKVRLAYFNPNAVGLNPLDYEGIRLMREDDDNGTGQYLFGPPSQAGVTTIWGVPSVQGVQFPVGQPVVGDFSVVELYIREGVQVLASDSHADFFTRNLVAILAEMRAGLVIPQPEGLCEVSEGS